MPNRAGRNLESEFDLDQIRFPKESIARDGQLTKWGHCTFQKGPVTMERGQYPAIAKNILRTENK